MDSVERAPVIMAVDDTPANLRLLEGILQARGYQTRALLDGRRALMAAEAAPPDLILLDIAMPGMDGFEVCRRLKANSALAAIPVIFITVLEGTDDKVEAFRCGGVDFVTKPFAADELCARVRTHLGIRSKQTRLEAHNALLDGLVDRRTADLAEAHQRLALANEAKNAFIGMASRALRAQAPEAQAGDTSAHAAPTVEAMRRSMERIANILENAEILARLDAEAETGLQAPVDLLAAVQYGIDETERKHPGARFEVASTLTQGAAIEGNAALVRHAFRGILRTAAAVAGPEATVTVRCTSAGCGAVIEVECRRGSVEPEVQAILAGMLNGAGPEAGTVARWLDTAVAHRILSLFGGSVSVRALEPDGALFVIRVRQAVPVPSA